MMAFEKTASSKIVLQRRQGRFFIGYIQ